MILWSTNLQILLLTTILDDDDEDSGNDIVYRFFNPIAVHFYTNNVVERDFVTHLGEAIEVIKRRNRRFENGCGIRWGIAYKPNNCLIGSCGFTWNKKANAAEIGYELASQFWRRGIMSEALYAILNYGFAIKKVQFVTAETMLENVASKRLLEKLGFQSQGIHRERGFWQGKHHNLEEFRLMRAKFTAV